MTRAELERRGLRAYLLVELVGDAHDGTLLAWELAEGEPTPGDDRLGWSAPWVPASGSEPPREGGEGRDDQPRLIEYQRRGPTHVFYLEARAVALARLDGGVTRMLQGRGCLVTEYHVVQ